MSTDTTKEVPSAATRTCRGCLRRIHPRHRVYRCCGRPLCRRCFLVDDWWHKLCCRRWRAGRVLVVGWGGDAPRWALAVSKA